MGMRNDSQNPCLDRYLRGMEQRERNKKRRRNARLKKLLKEAAICIGAAVLIAWGLLYMILNDPYEAPAAPIERTYEWTAVHPGGIRIDDERERSVSAAGGHPGMKMALTDGMVRIIEADAIQKTIIKSWNQMRWIRGQQMYEGIASAELLNKLATLVHLPPSIEAERIRMNTVQEAVDQERTREHPEPLYRYPVTKNLYEHQVRAANMALMTFGFIETPKKEEGGK